MRNDHGIQRANSGEDVALANKLLASGVPESKVKQLFKNRIDEDELNSVVQETRDDASRQSTVEPEIKRLVEEAKAPEEFLDPLYMQLMKGMFIGLILSNTIQDIISHNTFQNVSI